MIVLNFWLKKRPLTISRSFFVIKIELDFWQ